MGAKLQAIQELQQVESQIADIRRNFSRQERMVQSQQARIDVVRKAIEAERIEIRRAQADFDEIDVEVQGRTAHITKLREHLNTIRTNKEYAVVLQQINTEKADVSRLESAALEKLGKVEARKQAIGVSEKSEQDELARLKELQSRLDQSRASFANTLRDLEARRTAAATALDAESLTLFEKLAKHYDGEAMAKVIRTHPRRDEFNCEGCNMSVSAERANALMTRDELITCRNCGRILFMPPKSA